MKNERLARQRNPSKSRGAHTASAPERQRLARQRNPSKSRGAHTASAPERQSYDLIGDIHGEAGVLRDLLARLGYRQRAGAYRHPNRRVIFLGDYIDRGPAIRETLRIVRGMVEHGAAVALERRSRLRFRNRVKVRCGVGLRLSGRLRHTSRVTEKNDATP